MLPFQSPLFGSCHFHVLTFCVLPCISPVALVLFKLRSSSFLSLSSHHLPPLCSSTIAASCHSATPDASGAFASLLGAPGRVLHLRPWALPSLSVPLLLLALYILHWVVVDGGHTSTNQRFLTGPQWCWTSPVDLKAAAGFHEAMTVLFEEHSITAPSTLRTVVLPSSSSDIQHCTPALCSSPSSHQGYPQILCQYCGISYR